MPKFFARVDGAGRVVSAQYTSGDHVPPGHVDLTEIVSTVAEMENKQWTGTALVPAPPLPRRILNYAEFLERFTDPEIDGIETMALTHARVRAWQRVSQARGTVNLDGDAVGFLNYLKAQGVPDVWPSVGAANARIAVILT
jgi:hypothetical protein